MQFFTERGSWASQMTAAKVMDVIARFPDCDGQGADAVSAHTQVKLEGHLLVAQKSQIGMSRCLDTSSLAGLLWEWQIEEILLEFGRQKVLFKQGLFLSVYVDDIKVAGSDYGSYVEEIDETTWIFTNQHHFSWSRMFGTHSTRMKTEWNHDWGIYNDVWITYFCWNHWTVARWGKTSRKNSRVVLRHRKDMLIALRDTASWQTRKWSSSTKIEVRAWMITNSKKRKSSKQLEISKVCSQIVLTCLYLARIGRLDILWSVNKLARSITKWTKACGKRVARLISYIHHTCEFRKYWHVWNTAQQCRLGLFQDSDFAGDLGDSKSTSWILSISGSHTFVPICWMCKKQTSVSNGEAEIISLDAGSRVDGIPALALWIWRLKYFTPYRTNQKDARERAPETRQQSSSQTCTTP